LALLPFNVINRNTVVIIRRTEECVIRRIIALNGGKFSSNGEESRMKKTDRREKSAKWDFRLESRRLLELEVVPYGHPVIREPTGDGCGMVFKRDLRGKQSDTRE
jgi:hypothetical protein